MSISHWGIFPGFYVGRDRGGDLVVGLKPATWYRMAWDDWCEMHGSRGR